MFDVSQLNACTGPEGSRISDDSASYGNGWPMDVDFNPWPGIVPFFERDAMRTLEIGQSRIESAAIGNGQEVVSSQHPEPYHYGSSMTYQAIIPEINQASNVQSRYHNQNQMIDRLAVFERAYQHAPVTRHMSTAPLIDEEPRHVPEAIHMATGPWSPCVAGELNGGIHPVSELMYEPAMDVMVVDQKPQGHGYPGKYTDTNPDTLMAENVFLHDPPFQDMNIGPPPTPDPIGPPFDTAGGAKDHSSEDHKTGLVGGRRQGPLDPESRRNAQATRQRGGSCWSCALQRGQCTFENENDETCKTCKNRNKRTQSLLLKCICARLPDLTSSFIPASLAEQYDPQKLRTFASARVDRWLDNYMTVYLTWGYFRSIKCDVTEIESKGPSLLFQNQYRLNLETNQYDLVSVPSPPLGMVLMFVNGWRTKLDMYLEELLQTSFRGFPKVCFRGDACRVERDFLLPIFEYHQAASGKAQKLVHLSLKLVVVTHIMTHSMTLVESTKDAVYDQLRNPPRDRYPTQTSPRWLNKQFKFLLCALHQAILREFLGQIQELLRRANKKDAWAALFASMTVLAMTTESLQVSVRGKDETDKGEGIVRKDDNTANEAIEVMEERFEFLKNLFHQAHRTLSPKGLNPIQNIQDRACLDPASQSLAAAASEIIERYHDFLIARQVLPPPIEAREPQTARLVARFLLLFSPPTKQHHHQPADPASSQQTTENSTGRMRT